MIEVHHLNKSRSRRITWLLEELGTPYTVVSHERDQTTNLAPPALKAIHPLGKSPVIRDRGQTIIESGAIIDYLIRHYGNGRFQPQPTSPDYERYLQFLHYGEASAMLPILLRYYNSRLGDAGQPLHPRIDSELANHLGWLDRELAGRHWFVGDDLTGADIQLSFVAQTGQRYTGRDVHKNLAAFVDRLEARPAYQRAIQKWGE